ncbi:hypothetical protein NLI96_g7477 [Meripilus lineatus]|uniref:Uncharacterized protein n=1 Tax=Meripilus lineatus TaxID=2056292 RepID=A0AAD5YCX0_9APHY|nr:hypothetical protein NLI96_g7477 [Physisporinus lineatus]
MSAPGHPSRRQSSFTFKSRSTPADSPIRQTPPSASSSSKLGLGITVYLLRLPPPEVVGNGFGRRIAQRRS